MLEKRRDFWMRDATGAEAKRFASEKRKRIGEISRCFSDSKRNERASNGGSLERAQGVAERVADTYLAFGVLLRLNRLGAAVAFESGQEKRSDS